MANAIQVKGFRSTDAALARVLRKQDPKEVRNALMPAARIGRRSIFLEAPVGATRKLRRSVRIRKSRRLALVMVAVDRKKALRESRKFPRGFPYVNSVISERRRGSRADKFVERGFDKVEQAIADQAMRDLGDLITGAF